MVEATRYSLQAQSIQGTVTSSSSHLGKLRPQEASDRVVRMSKHSHREALLPQHGTEALCQQLRECTAMRADSPALCQK